MRVPRSGIFVIFLGDNALTHTRLFVISIYSARIAREEDEEQLRLIEEEERQERKRKLAKKRKLSHR